LSDLNPGLSPGSSPPAGEEIIVPDDEEIQVNEPLPESEGEIPSAGGDPPGDRGFFLGPVESDVERSSEPTGLRLEFLFLGTDETYESLHCYVGLAEASPQWYPDDDHDQTTDEYFSVLDSVIGRDTSWNIQEYISGENVPVLFWPGDHSIPFEISCVGITGGGTQALDLGYLEFFIEPLAWDGIARLVDVSGPEGGFTLGYRVSPVESPYEVKEIDPNMAVPTNLRAVNFSLFGLAAEEETGEGVSSFFVSEEGPFVLMWDYNPEPNELPVDGFRIYLNGNLQWTEAADRLRGNAHYTVFPPEWRQPPCGEEYTLTVSAWRAGGIDGHESNQADPAIVYGTPADDCRRYLDIEILTLETFDIGSDGRYDHRDGDVGPPYGNFYANEDIVTFDTGHPDDQLIPPGLSSNSIIDMQNLDLFNWGFSGHLRWAAALDEANTAILGFEIWDEDDGDCDDADDPGCPDLICAGQEYISDNGGRSYEGELWADNRRCRITFSAGMAAGSQPASGSLYGSTPAPLLMIENLVADERNRSTFQIENQGNAAWSYRTLTIEVLDRSNNILDTITLEDLNLEPGASYDVEYLSGGLPAVNTCFRLVIESQSEMFGDPVCPGYPNLTISDLRVDEDDGRLLVEVSNTGTSDLYQQDIMLEWHTRDGEPLGEYVWEAAILRRGESVILFENSMVYVPEPYDICAVVHLNDGIHETNEYDQSTCTPLPDLTITNVEYQSESEQGNTINVTVRNNLEDLTNRTVYLQVNLSDGGSALFERPFPDVNLSRNGEIVLNLPVPSEIPRLHLLDGYTVTVNPENTIAEATYNNNSYSVRGWAQLQLFWCSRFIPYSGGAQGTSAATMNFSAFVVSGSTSRLVMERDWSHEVTEFHSGFDDDPYARDHYLYSPDSDVVGSCVPGSDPFEIMGDEVLNVVLSATYRAGRAGSFDPIGSSSRYFLPNEHWGAGRTTGESVSWQDPWQVCSQSGGRHFTQVWYSGLGNSGFLGSQSWHSYFLVCEIIP
jgi:hypothetical protein